MSEKQTNATKKVYKSRKNRIIDGVCGGFAEFWNLDVTLVRILWLLAIFMGGLGLFAYIAAMILIPIHPDHLHLKEGEKEKTKPGIFWGIGLIVLGFFLIFDHWFYDFHWRFPFRGFQFWDMNWEFFWPLLLVGLGVFYIIHASKKSKVKESEPTPSSGETLYRSKKEKMIGGVCGGISQRWKIDANLVRIGFVVLALLTHLFLWGLIYIVLLIVLPEDPE